MNGSLIEGDAYDYFVGKPSQNMKGENFLTVFQALSLMIAFATLMILVINTSNKKWPFYLAVNRSFFDLIYATVLKTATLELVSASSFFFKFIISYNYVIDKQIKYNF